MSFVPTFSVYISEVSQNPMVDGLDTIEQAREWAGMNNCSKYIIRRSRYIAGYPNRKGIAFEGTFYRGMVVASKN